MSIYYIPDTELNLLHALIVPRILQARIMEWVVISSSRESSGPKDWICVSFVFCIVGGFFTHWAIGEANYRLHTSFQNCKMTYFLGLLFSSENKENFKIYISFLCCTRKHLMCFFY